MAKAGKWPFSKATGEPGITFQENEGGGKTVVLAAGADLAKVPKSHRRLITPVIREAFTDPEAYFAAMAKRCQFAKMAKWLKKLVAEGRWELHLNQGAPEQFTLAGFHWSSDEVIEATFSLPNKPFKFKGLPAALEHFFSLVEELNWGGFGCGGGLTTPYGPARKFALNDGEGVDLDQTFIWGESACGDMLVYTTDGRGGWFSPGGSVHFLGTIEKTINWVFAELLAGRVPEFEESEE